MSEETATLRAMIEPLLREAKNDLAKTGTVTPLLLFVRGETHRLIHVPPHVAEMLNSGDGKDALFDGLRNMVRDARCTACAILTDTWMRKTTDAGARMEPGKWMKLFEEIGAEEMEKLGLVRSFEAITVNAQTPERTLLLSQPYTRGENSITFGASEEHEGPTDQFEGRKMFGDTSDERLHRHRDSKRGTQ